MERGARIGVGLLAVGLLFACGGEEADESFAPIRQPGGPTAKTRVVRKAGEAEAAPPETAFTYSPVGKRDPFRSFLADLEAQRENEAQRPLSATEQFDIDQYRLTALVTGTSQPKAMVEDPAGVGHTLRVGSRLGKNGGRVTRISATGVLVTEELVNGVGKRVRVPVTLKLPDETESIIVESSGQ